MVRTIFRAACSKASLVTVFFTVVMGVGATTGCGPAKPDIPLGQVTGRVTWKGNLLPNALVAFEPEKGRGSYGRTDASGNYALSYRGQPWGAVIGSHVVRITTQQLLNEEADKEGGAPDISAEILPPQFNRRSTLTAEVSAGTNTINFDLSPK
jgi:hypothetical protein